jgi:arginine:ornithine antiporter / lysine permease
MGDEKMNNKKLGFWLLTALVAGNMVGSAIFMLPQSLSQVGTPAGVLLAWAFTGMGVLMLAHVFGQLAERKPDVIGGPPSYARELFNGKTKTGQVSGFLTSWGYWTSNSPGNAAVLTTLIGYLTYFLPVLHNKEVLFSIGSFDLKTGNLLTFLISSAVLWSIHFLMFRGTYSTGKINFVATVAKVLGFIFFIVVVLSVFETKFLHPFAGTKVLSTGESIGLVDQMNKGALLTLWAFVGIESAVFLSGRAKNQKDVKWATLAGLVISLAIYLLVTFFTMGALSQQELMQTDKPLVDVLTHIIGDKGSMIMAFLGVMSMVGASIGWIMLSGEVPYQSAKQNLFPHWFMGENKNGAPVNALWITNGLTQIFLISTLSETISGSFNMLITIATLATLVPYLLSALYSLKVVFKGENYRSTDRPKRSFDGLLALLATLYSLWVIKSGLGDLKTFGLGMLLIFSGIILAPWLPKHK